MTADFSSARELLRWAVEGLNEFQAVSQAVLGNRDNYTQVREFNADGSEVTIKLRGPPLPQVLPKLATHVLWDIKHALDHATYAAVTGVLGCEPRQEVYFPVGNHPNNFLDRVSGPKSRFPLELWPTLEGFECYPTGNGYSGGNDVVVTFNNMANSSKHAVSLTAYAAAGLHRATGRGKIGGATLFPNGFAFRDDHLTLGVFPYDPEMEMHLDLSFLVTFGEVELLEGRRADFMLGTYAGYAQQFIDELEADVAAILTERP